MNSYTKFGKKPLKKFGMENGMECNFVVVNISNIFSVLYSKFRRSTTTGPFASTCATTTT